METIRNDVESKSAGIARLLSKVIFGGLLATITFTAIPYGTVEAWWESLFEVLIFLLTALWIIEGGLRGSWFVREHRLLLPLVALVVFAFLQSLSFSSAESVGGGFVKNSISFDSYGTRLAAFKLLALTLAAGLLLRYTSSMKRLKILIYVVIGIAICSGFFGIVRQTTQRGEASFVLPELSAGTGYAQFINRNHFAFLMEMAFGLTLGLMIDGVRRQRLLMYIAVAMPVWVALILSNSRGGLLSMISQVLFFALALTFVSGRKTAPEAARLSSIRRFGDSPVARIGVGVCLVFAIIAGMFWVGGEPLAERIGSISSETGEELVYVREGSRRVEIWHATLQLIRDNPVAGSGLGAYWIAIATHHDASGVATPQQAHNDYIELLAGGGLIGAVLAGWFIVRFSRYARTQLGARDNYRRAACLGAICGMFGVAVHSFMDFGLHITVNALVFTALLVIATADFNFVVNEKDAARLLE